MDAVKGGQCHHMQLCGRGPTLRWAASFQLAELTNPDGPWVAVAAAAGGHPRLRAVADHPAQDEEVHQAVRGPHPVCGRRNAAACKEVLPGSTLRQVIHRWPHTSTIAQHASRTQKQQVVCRCCVCGTRCACRHVQLQHNSSATDDPCVSVYMVVYAAANRPVDLTFFTCDLLVPHHIR